ncbi:T9SS type A sorting domain-containing protein [Ferruginibacter sp.]
MKKFYPFGVAFFVVFAAMLLPKVIFAQDCSTLTATYVISESRCASTGTIQINATGGSGNYNYKANGPITINYTTNSLLTGMLPGRYLITVKDINTNCIYNQDSVTVTGNYLAPNFTMVATGVTCINGNNGIISVSGQTNGRSPFTYKIIAPSASGVGTISTAGNFTGLLSGSYLIQMSDSCGAIQTRSIIIENYSWIINTYTVTKIGCDTISVTFNLTDSKGNATPNAVFNGFLYGASVTTGDTSWFTTNTFKYYKAKKRSVKLFIKDPCGNIKSAVWTDTAIPGVSSTVSISNKVCSTFTATITGKVNLTGASYCIYDNSNVLVACNTTGIFNALPYGSYCIKITEPCYDTTINRCFTVARPVPSVDASVQIARFCNSFTATVTGQTNLNSPNYCLYNAANVLLSCNATGIFSNLAYGTYCIKVANSPACYDTLITRCFTVNKPRPSINSVVAISNLTCATFTATIKDTANWNSPQFCLYTPAHVLIMCNSTGVFNNLPYGSYCIDVVNNPACYDTTITRCFTVIAPKPSLSAMVTVSNKTCATFTATITGQTNINNPLYCLYNSANVLVSCNATGIFTGIPYGSYCIDTKNDAACYDTTIKRCFSAAQNVLNISLSANRSCNVIGASDIKVGITSGTPGYSISLYAPSGAFMQSLSTSGTSVTFLSIPNLDAPLMYKIIATDNCNNKDTDYVAPKVYRANRLITTAAKCPSAASPNGASDVVINIADNNIGGSIVPKIIKKNSSVVSVNASSNAGYQYTFSDLAPATYIFDTYITDCNKHLYDTVTVNIYIFPSLNGTNAYQCDNNGFSVSVNAFGGKAPYMYEIFGSSPSLPAIITSPQASTVFSINNGSNYSLIRLRVVDGCGNASLHDASILPLANFSAFSDSMECFNHSLTLRTDSIANADYTWYKRVQPDDSVIVGTGTSLHFSNLLPSDTGRYFCRIVVNNGCLIKYANYVLTGFCRGVLPIDITLTGIKENDGNKLYWNAGSLNVNEYILQSTSNRNYGYQDIGVIKNNAANIYSFADKNPANGINYYRLKVSNLENKIEYSNTVSIKNAKFDISFYPNPVNSVLYISISDVSSKNYAIEMYNIEGQKMMSKTYNNIQNAVINYPRNSMITPGVYSLIITELKSGEKQTYRVVYK